MNVHSPQKPVIALAMGDPAGISPELTAKLACLDEVRACARLIVIGDRRVFDRRTQGGGSRGARCERLNRFARG